MSEENENVEVTKTVASDETFEDVDNESGIIGTYRGNSLEERAMEYAKNSILLLSSLGIGIILFTYAVTGVSLSFGLAITVLGILIAFFFFKSLPYILHFIMNYACALTDTPPSQFAMIKYEGNIFQQTLGMIKDRRYMSILGYMIFISLPYGIFAFTITVTLFSLSLGLIAAIVYPIVELILGKNLSPDYIFGSEANYLPVWIEYGLVLLLPVAGFFLLKFSIKLTDAIANNYASTLVKLTEL